jgi:hypothetical protein
LQEKLLPGLNTLHLKSQQRVFSGVVKLHQHAARMPICVPDVEVEEFELKTDLIIKIQDQDFKEQNDENRMHHLLHFSSICDILGHRGVAK